MIWGYHYFWKHPCIVLVVLRCSNDERLFRRPMPMLQEVTSHVGMALAGDSISDELPNRNCLGVNESAGCHNIIALNQFSKSKFQGASFIQFVNSTQLPACLDLDSITGEKSQVASPSMVQSFRMKISS